MLPGNIHVDTFLAHYNPCPNDPFGATSMPIYQSATFQQPGAAEFGQYDYTRSGNPTRTALEVEVALLEGMGDSVKGFCFSTGMAAISCVSRLVKCGEEIIVNDDSYGGTYRLMSQVAVRQGIVVKYLNMAGQDGSQKLQDIISANTRMVIIESPSNPNQRICDVRSLSEVCKNTSNALGTLLVIDNTMMSPILSQPLTFGADIVMHSATKFYGGHSDTMGGIVCVNEKMEGTKTLAESIYFYQNSEGNGLAPFDCWLMLRGVKTMALRVNHQQNNAMIIANWLKTCSYVTKVLYAGLPDHVDYELHRTQASGGGSVVCFLTGNVPLSEHIVTTTKLFKITVSFGNVSSLISIPGLMSHASIPSDVKSEREFPMDLIRISVGIENVQDLIHDLETSMESYGK